MDKSVLEVAGELNEMEECLQATDLVCHRARQEAWGKKRITHKGTGSRTTAGNKETEAQAPDKSPNVP
jgi:hypothetical protein